MAPFICSVVPSACVSVSVNGFALPEAGTRKKYMLMLSNPGESQSDLEFQEYSAELVRALDQKGYVQVATPEEGDILICVRYGRSDPMRSTRTTTSTEYRTKPAPPPPVDKLPWGNPPASAQGGIPFSNTLPSPKREAVETTDTTVVRTYTRWLSLTAWDIKLALAYDGPQKQIWREVAESRGVDGDLRDIMPILVLSASEHFAEDTGRAVWSSTGINDKAVSYIRTGVPVNTNGR